MQIKIDDLSGGEVIALLEEHLTDMYKTSPPESVHALDVAALKSPDITFFSAWLDGNLAGCVAIKHLGNREAELKSMRTANAYRNQGVGRALLVHVINFTREQHYQAILLETGTQDFFKPAHRLYKKFGFEECPPFGNYQLDPNSVFMKLHV